MAAITLPEVFYREDPDSMLRRRFGEEIVNYYAGSPLNRVAFLRENSRFLAAAFAHNATKFLMCKELNPLGDKHGKVVYSTQNDIQSLFGENPYSISDASSTIPQEPKPQLVFLGLNESSADSASFQWQSYRGNALFAIDVTPRQPYVEEAKKVIVSQTEKGLDFLIGRQKLMSLPHQEAAVYAEARSLLDWNQRNPFCAGCGQRTRSINGGFKRQCPTVPGTDCATRHGVSNLSFPRTDPTIIVAILSHDSQRILLGRQKSWPPNWYSTLAGFVEPAESLEEAVRREVWEEAGVRLSRVVIHSSQPWPFPANLMIGAIAQTLPDNENIELKHDPELEDARWFSLEEVRTALDSGTAGLGESPGDRYIPGSLRLPPRTAIANQLLTAVSNPAFLDDLHSKI